MIEQGTVVGELGRARALIVAHDEALISSEISARITKIGFRPGEEFKKGDTLITFDCASYVAQREIGTAEVAAANAKLGVQKRLFALKSRGALDVQLAEAELARAKAQAALYQVNVDRCAIKAAYDGRVVEWHARPQESVNPSNELIKIVGTDSLAVELIVPSTWKNKLTAKQTFSVQVDETGTTHPAMIRNSGSMVDPVSQTLTVYGEFTDKTAQILIPGMSGIAILGSN